MNLQKSSRFFFFLSNALSLSRAPLAFLFLNSNPSVRATSVFLAMLTDSIDGFLARKAHSTSRFGAIIDPIMDKFFVYFVLSILFIEKKIGLTQWLAFTSRDIAILIFGSYLLSRSLLKTYEIKSIILGKISTGLQFLFLTLLSFDFFIPAKAYWIFIPLGFSVFIELFYSQRKSIPKEN